MADCMEFPKDWAKFLEDYSFRDHKEFYTNGARLIPTFRVEQMMHHYLRKAAEDAPAVQQWIPVSEGLPFAEYGESKDVLAVTELGVIRVLFFDGGNWCFQNGECCTHKITHWMPMPEQPKGD